MSDFLDEEYDGNDEPTVEEIARMNFILASALYQREKYVRRLRDTRLLGLAGARPIYSSNSSEFEGEEIMGINLTPKPKNSGVPMHADTMGVTPRVDVHSAHDELLRASHERAAAQHRTTIGRHAPLLCGPGKRVAMAPTHSGMTENQKRIGGLSHQYPGADASSASVLDKEPPSKAFDEARPAGSWDAGLRGRRGFRPQSSGLGCTR